jgi:hypothetical protein
VVHVAVVLYGFPVVLSPQSKAAVCDRDKTRPPLVTSSQVKTAREKPRFRERNV